MMNNNRKTYKFKEILKEKSIPIEMNDERTYHLSSIKRRNGGFFDRELKRGKEILTKTLSKVIPGSFVISKMQVVHGACAIAPKDIGERYISNSYISFISKDQSILDIDYLYGYSHTKKSYDSFLKSSYGVHIEKMTFKVEQWLEKSIELPTIEKQKKVVRIIKSVDLLIKNIESQISKIVYLRKSLLSKLLKEGVKHKEFKSSLIGNLPCDWELLNGFDILELGSGTSPSNLKFSDEGDILYIKVDDFNNVENSTYIKTAKLRYSYTENPKYKPYPKGTVVIAKRGAAIQKNRIKILTRDTYVDTNIMTIQSKRFIPEFLAIFLENENISTLADMTSIPQLNNFHLNEYNFSLPPESEQKEIIQIINSVTNLIDAKKEKLLKFNFLRKSLIDMFYNNKS